MTDLSDKSVLVTGAGPVLGRACAAALGQRGARLCLADAHPAAAQALLGDVSAAAVITVHLEPLDEASWVGPWWSS